MKIYLAIPYTFNPELSFEIANKVAAKLMQAGNIVFSPISHGHAIAGYLIPDLRIDNDFWIKQNESMIEWCDEVLFIEIGEHGADLIAQSKGCKMEFTIARKYGKSIKKIKYTQKVAV